MHQKHKLIHHHYLLSMNNLSNNNHSALEGYPETNIMHSHSSSPLHEININKNINSKYNLNNIHQHIQHKSLPISIVIHHHYHHIVHMNQIYIVMMIVMYIVVIHIVMVPLV